MTPPRTDLWSEERERRLIALVATERRVIDVAEKLGCTKNAVIGKIGRLKRAGVLRETHWLWSADRKGAEVRWPRLRRRSPRPRIKPEPPPPKEPPPMTRPPEPWEPHLIPAFPMRQLTIMQLTDRTCRWPVGDPGTPGFFFCGNDTPVERPYCPVHHKAAHG